MDSRARSLRRAGTPHDGRIERHGSPRWAGKRRRRSQRAWPAGGRREAAALLAAAEAAAEGDGGEADALIERARLLQAVPEGGRLAVGRRGGRGAAGARASSAQPATRTRGRGSTTGTNTAAARFRADRPWTRPPRWRPRKLEALREACGTAVAVARGRERSVTLKEALKLGATTFHLDEERRSSSVSCRRRGQRSAARSGGRLRLSLRQPKTLKARKQRAAERKERERALARLRRLEAEEEAASAAARGWTCSRRTGPWWTRLTHLPSQPPPPHRTNGGQRRRQRGNMRPSGVAASPATKPWDPWDPRPSNQAPSSGNLQLQRPRRPAGRRPTCSLGPRTAEAPDAPYPSKAEAAAPRLGLRGARIKRRRGREESLSEGARRNGDGRTAGFPVDVRPSPRNAGRNVGAAAPRVGGHAARIAAGRRMAAKRRAAEASNPTRRGAFIGSRR